uniref:Uncharacterized protein n=1 Tax=Pediastrum duplex TaxID=3105 RepID=A0A2U8GIJ9_PEDDU|nr:hypothetical protein [Pediastrum duplex]
MLQFFLGSLLQFFGKAFLLLLRLRRTRKCTERAKRLRVRRSRRRRSGKAKRQTKSKGAASIFKFVCFIICEYKYHIKFTRKCMFICLIALFFESFIQKVK